jgi:hypothetical protein
VNTNDRAPRRPSSRRPLYARLLGLRYVRPSALMSFLLFECAIAVAALLALAELVSWWAVAVLPLSIAAMVKLDDVVTGTMRRAARPIAVKRASAPQRPTVVPTEGVRDDPPPVWAGEPAMADTAPPRLARFGDARRVTDSAERRYSRHASTTNERRFGRSA